MSAEDTRREQAWRRSLLKSTIGAMISLAVWVTCSSNHALRTEGSEQQTPPAADSLQSAHQLELTRNWSFGFENYKNRRYEEVPHFFWRVIQMDSAKFFADVYSVLANSYLQLGKPDSARVVYEIGIGALPQNAHLYRGLAALFASQNEFVAAIGQYQKVIALNAAGEDDYLQLSQLYRVAGDTANAVKMLAKLQEMAPQDFAVRRELATLNHAGSNHQDEVDWRSLELTLQQSPDDSRTLLALGKAYYGLQQYEKCASVLERYIQLVPGDVYAREYLGGAYVGLQKYNEAIAEFTTIIARDHDDVHVLTQMAHCYLRLQEWPTARRYAHRALAVDARAGLARLAVGEIYEAAARACIAARSNVMDFSDKLVFQLAYEQFERALLDPRWQHDAHKRMMGIEPYLPRPEEYFMNKNQDRPQGECYSWIYQ